MKDVVSYLNYSNLEYSSTVVKYKNIEIKIYVEFLFY